MDEDKIIEHYETTEQKLLYSNERKRKTTKEPEYIQGCRVIPTSRAIVAVIVLFIGIFIAVPISNSAEDLGTLLLSLAICIATLASAFAIMLGTTDLW